MTKFNRLLSLVILTLSLSPVVAFAQTETSISPTLGARKEAIKERLSSTHTARANEAIDRRIASLNELITRIQSMKKITDAQKTSLVTQAQSLLTSLSMQKDKIAQDTDLETLKADKLAIYTQFRVYALIVPKFHILIWADRLNYVLDQMSQVADKLQTRITESSNKGLDVATLQTTLTDAKAKISDARIQTQKATDAVTALVADQGDKTIGESNRATMQTAMGYLKAAHADIKIARQDFETVRKGLKQLKTSSKPTPTTPAQ